ncbi:hypothetical protein [Thalassomonas haliotis]|uniref:Uncharacterized protein n=1 Tax=Thalassomonas haliotis TaxID=485448 RepID=A0ABY7VK98_9GAMM|nr:hypothetical protein [Thalassomonas haliotis]WDE14164.1 hypothetical protein H3N35_12560 [Thalassomonas haliotis]
MVVVKNQTNVLIVLFSTGLGIVLGFLAIQVSNLALGFSSTISCFILMFGHSRKRKILNRCQFIGALSPIIGWALYVSG